MEIIYVCGQCENCGTNFEGKTNCDRSGCVRCPKCGHLTENWNPENWIEEKPEQIVKF